MSACGKGDPLAEPELTSLAVVRAETDPQAEDAPRGVRRLRQVGDRRGAVERVGRDELEEEVAWSAVLRAEAGVVTVDVGRAVVEDAEAFERRRFRARCE